MGGKAFTITSFAFYARSIEAHGRGSNQSEFTRRAKRTRRRGLGRASQPPRLQRHGSVEERGVRKRSSQSEFTRQERH